MNLRRTLLLAALAVLVLPLTACGNKSLVITHAGSEGDYLSVGALTYQVQISRQLNPADPEDRAYLVGLDPADRTLAPDESWFAVFVRVWNEGKQPAPAASEFKVTDTQDNVYRPVGFGLDNAFAYRPLTLAPGDQIPTPDTAAANNPSVNGALVLFKVKISSFEDRPLVLTITSPPGGKPAEATVDLDV
jgi:hypothetical protein